MTICALQIKLSRISLKWTVDDLAQKSEISWSVIQNSESNEGYIERKPDVQAKLKSVFENEGIEFFNADNSYQPYIKLKK